MRVQRLRVTFARGEPLRFISHLDLQRFWERALRRAGVAVAYTEGFTPHPMIALGSPLPLGITGGAELLDVVLSERTDPEQFRIRLQDKLPDGVAISQVREAPLDAPSIQSQLCAAEFQLTLPPGADPDNVERSVAGLMAAESWPMEQQREKGVKRYDLRPLIEWLRLDRAADPPVLLMRLRAEPSATGRADQVASALGLSDAVRIHRLGLILREDE